MDQSMDTPKRPTVSDGSRVQSGPATRATPAQRRSWSSWDSSAMGEKPVIYASEEACAGRDTVTRQLLCHGSSLSTAQLFIMHTIRRGCNPMQIEKTNQTRTVHLKFVNYSTSPKMASRTAYILILKGLCICIMQYKAILPAAHHGHRQKWMQIEKYA